MKSFSLNQRRKNIKKYSEISIMGVIEIKTNKSE